MQTYRTEMSVPVRVDTGPNTSERFIPTRIPVSRDNTDKGFSTTGSRSNATNFDGGFHNEPASESFPPPWFDRTGEDLFSRPCDQSAMHRAGDSDRWFEEMRQRFDERRRQWDENVRKMRESFFTPFPGSEIKPRLDRSGSPSKTEHPVSTHYDRGDDGRLHFIAVFDVRGFDESDLKVTLRDNQIFVSGNIQRRAGNCNTTKEFTRSVDLPRGAEESQMSASLSDDYKLTVDCPIRPTAIQGPGLNSTSGSSMSRSSDMGTVSGLKNSGRVVSSPSPYLSSISSLSPQKFHVEIQIGEDYQPGEINVRTLNSRVYISARHEERVSNRNTFREFSKEYDIPEYIDPRSVTARLEQGILHLEGMPFA